MPSQNVAVVPKGEVLFMARIYRRDARLNPQVLFVFGYNMQRCGLGSLAKELRGEPNSIGIPTKWAPSMAETAFFRDSQVALIQPTLDAEFAKIGEALEQGKRVVFPSAGIGTGWSKLPEKAPLIYGWLTSTVAELASVYPAKIISYL